MRKDQILQIIKIVLGTSLAIILAFAIKLNYATSAGIVTLLTIQNTRRDTIRLALSRVVSFLFTMFISGICVTLIPMDALAFLLFMAVLVPVSMKLKWMGALSVNVVLGTHVIYMERHMSLSLFGNEAMMVLVGIAIALILNAHMTTYEEEIRDDILNVQKQLQDILCSVAGHVKNEVGLKEDETHVESLITKIDQVMELAMKNRDDIMKSHSEYYVDCLNMRRNQCEMLIGFYYEVANYQFNIPETEIISELIRELSDDLDVQKDLNHLKERLHDYENELLHGSMPKNGVELESKIILYRLTKELGEMLYHQENFRNSVTEEQKKRYWDESIT